MRTAYSIDRVFRCTFGEDKHMEFIKKLQSMGRSRKEISDELLQVLETEAPEKHAKEEKKLEYKRLQKLDPWGRVTSGIYPSSTVFPNKSIPELKKLGVTVQESEITLEFGKALLTNPTSCYDDSLGQSAPPGLVVVGKLPYGWTVRNNKKDPRHANYYDENGLLRFTAFIKSDIWSYFTSIIFNTENSIEHNLKSLDSSEWIDMEIESKKGKKTEFARRLKLKEECRKDRRSLKRKSKVLPVTKNSSQSV